MEPKDFCYWLQGFTELSGSHQPTIAQWEMICEHLQLVFTKVTSELHEDDMNLSEDPYDLMETIIKRLRETSQTIEELHKKEPSSETVFCTQYGPLLYPQNKICADVACVPTTNKKNEKLC